MTCRCRFALLAALLLAGCHEAPTLEVDRPTDDDVVPDGGADTESLTAGSDDPQSDTETVTATESAEESESEVASESATGGPCPDPYECVQSPYCYNERGGGGYIHSEFTCDLAGWVCCEYWKTIAPWTCLICGDEPDLGRR